jgi:hypothetical protein
MRVLTRGRSGRFVLIATLLGMVVALAIVLPSGDATGQVPAKAEVDAGVILMSTGPEAGDNWVRYYAEPTAPLDVDAYDAHQAIDISRRCNVSTDDSLLAISQGGGEHGIGLVSNGYGVKTNDRCTPSQGRIKVGKTLTFALGSLFSEDEASYEINRVEVDVESKYGADLGFSYSLDGDAGFGTVELSNSSRRNHDQGLADNNIASIEPESNFIEITFTPEGPLGLGGFLDESSDEFRSYSRLGQVAIEGGGDGTIPGGTLRTAFGVNQSLFDLVMINEFEAQDLDCGDVVGPTSESEGGVAAAITLGRGANLKEDPCTEVAYTFRIEADSVFLDADLASLDQENANMLVRIDWNSADPAIDPFNTPHREVNYFPNVDADDFDPVPACVRLLDEGTVIDPDPDPDDVYEHPIGPVGDPAKFDGEIVPWCLAGEKLVLLASGEWQQVQWYDGAGDPRWR